MLWSLVLVGLCVVIFLILAFRWIHVHHMPKPKSKLKLRDVNFKSGDLLLCSGHGERGGFGASVLRLISNTQWTHLAMIYVDDKTGYPYIWDMDTRGARLLNLDAFLKMFKGYTAVRSINKNVDQEEFKKFIQMKWNKSYDYEFWLHGYNRMFPLMPLPASTPSKRDKNSYFCCDLVAETLEHLGVLQFDPKEDNVKNNDRGCNTQDKSLSDCPTMTLKKEAMGMGDFESKSTALPLCPTWKFAEEVMIVP